MGPFLKYVDLYLTSGAGFTWDTLYFHENPFNGSRVVTFGQMDGHTRQAYCYTLRL
jgi:hypothetical protein